MNSVIMECLLTRFFINLVLHLVLVGDIPITENPKGTTVEEEPHGYHEWSADDII